MSKHILFILALLVLLTALVLTSPTPSARAAGPYFVVTLPPHLRLGGGHVINSNRQIVMNNINGVYGNDRAFVWQDGVLTEIVDTFEPLHVVSASAQSINENGAVTGSALGENERDRAFRWENGVMTNLGYYPLPNLVGVEQGFGFGINASGTVAGGSSGLSFPCGFPSPSGTPQDCSMAVGTLFSGGAPTPLDTLTPCEYFCNDSANDINDADVIVGYSTLADSFSCCYQAVKWVGTSPTRLDTDNSVNSFAHAINNSGQIVWSKEITLYGNRLPMLSDGNGATNMIANYAEYTSGTFQDINDNGQAVGGLYRAATNTRVAVLYENGVVTDLNTLLPDASPWYLHSAVSINENGDIVGEGFYGGDTTKSLPFLLTMPDFIVNTEADHSDATPDGECDNGSGECSLREAIQESNATAKLDLVAFNIPGSDVPTIQPSAFFPNIINPIYLDATTQPNTGTVEIDGSNLPTGDFGFGGDGFVFKDDGNTLKGFVINRVNGLSIFLDNSDSNTIQGNLINTDVTGMTLAARTDGGVFAKNSSDNLIGGTIALTRNVIAQGGILIRNDGAALSTDNVIQGNYLALNKNGGALAGGRNGLSVEGNNHEMDSNVVPYGISVDGNNNTVQGNFIGTDATGATAFADTGIALVMDGDDNIIGGALGGGNVIVSAFDYGIQFLSGADNNQITYNAIGVDATGTVALGNGYAGIYFTSGTGNQIKNNTIAKSGQNPDDPQGVTVYRAGIALENTTQTLIQNNYVGTNAQSATNFGNLDDGIELDGATNNTVTNNVIAGNQSTGIELNNGANFNTIKQNGIGTDTAGNLVLGNGLRGISIYLSTDNIIGAPYEGNLIANNTGAGIFLAHNSSTRNKIQGNTLRANTILTGDATSGNGVHLSGGLDNEIGGTGNGEGNFITANENAGVLIEQSGVIGYQPARNPILGNEIYANGGLGIAYVGADPIASAPVITSWTTDEDNGGGGGDSFGAADNSPDARDAVKGKVKKLKKKAQTGARDSQSNNGEAKKKKGKNKKNKNHPAPEFVQTGSGTINIVGTLDGTANTTYRIEYFANNACDTSNFGEGETIIGSETVTTNGGGHFNLNATLNVSIPQNAFVTATATDPNNNTSIFSNCKATIQLVVNDNGDAVDANVGDGACETAGGVCTLRAAIQEANAQANADKITFNIPGGGVPTIQPTSELPTITAPLTIDGTTQPNTNWVELDGTESGNQKDGLEISAGSSTIKGLVINRFGGHGIHLATNGGNTIVGNRIGTDVTGTTHAGNATSIYSENAPNNVLGGTSSQEGNLFADSVWLLGANGGGNTIKGNYFGTDVNGMTAFVFSAVIASSPQNTIGGTQFGAGNLLLGGASLQGDDNVVQGNLIGTDITGANSLDFANGIKIEDGSNNLIGGDSNNARNVIANVGDAIDISASADEILTGNQIINNYIGVSKNGNDAMGNRGAGIVLETTPFSNAEIKNTIIRNNIISNSGLGTAVFGDGIHVNGLATGTIIQGNKFGTDKNGTVDFGNRDAGIYLNKAKNGTLGGTNFGEGNVISGNRDGIVLDSQSDNNTVQGNFIGVNAQGDTALGNDGSGILITYSKNNLIGGTTQNAANIIGANGDYGIQLYDTQTEGNIVQGNYIGTNPYGAQLGNDLGVYVEQGGFNNGPEQNFIGGTSAGQGNTIAYNHFDGVVLHNAFNFVRGNSIFNNDRLGMDVGAFGVDSDTPALLTAYFDNGTLEISGGRETSPGGTYGLDVFANGSCDSSGHGEGETYLGSADIELDDNGLFDASFAANLSNGAQLTLTFTGSSTEEFSECLQLSAPSYVSNAPNCNGNSPCYGTLTEAIAQAPRGSVILVLGGTYTENVSINRQLGVYFTGDVTINGSFDLGSAFVKGTSGSLTVTGNVNAANAHYVNNGGTFVFNGNGAPTLASTAPEALTSSAQTYTGDIQFHNVIIGANTILDTGASNLNVQGNLTNNGALQNTPNAQAVNDATMVSFKDGAGKNALGLASNGAQGLGNTNVSIVKGVTPLACGAQNFPTTAIKRHINITPANQNQIGATLRLYYDPSEANGLNLNNVMIYHCNGTAWQELAGPYTRGTANGLNYVQVNGVTAFSPFGMGGSAPTSATLVSSKPKVNKKGNVQVKWKTGTEVNVVGFNIYRSAKQDGEYKILNAELLAAKSAGEVTGNKYTFKDKKVKGSKTYFYKIEVVKSDGSSEWSEPLKTKIP